MPHSNIENGQPILLFGQFLHGGIPCCGNNYCRYLYDDSVSCAIKPSRAESGRLRKERVEG